ncbi:hypothetical protein BCR34DRAFT_628404 [Clohesyomyces aquaticus]|uniref:Mid2 domain-containing protein n=1 Tax=Clohesyomyces aquaticus TaxID=1231657 RepID=A0A1Y1YKD6_9PLEO|nr:hypothetical protein BCR34DRAFT_628404 [Clohesyomyces aquaticus]
MRLISPCAIICVVSSLGLVAASLVPIDVTVLSTASVYLRRERQGQVIAQLPHDLFTASKDTKTNVSLSAGVEVKCTTCYMKGKATVQLDVNGNFNASKAFHTILDSVEETVKNITDEVGEQLQDDFKEFLTTLGENPSNAFDAFQSPTINTSFSVGVKGIPECLLQLQFDGMELYMLLDTTLTGSASYTLNIYQSNSPLGIAIQDVHLGVWFSLDLMLDAEAAVDISSGFHIKLDDGLKISIPMFDKNVSDMVIPGAHFEFLPVKIESAGAVLTATLRISAHAGVSLEAPDFKLLPPISGGIEVAVFANMAKFVTNVTVDTSGSGDCALKVEEYYEFAIGANAGATVAVGDETWGPQPAKTIPVFYTTLADACAIKGKATPTPTVTPRALLDARANMKTTTISTELTYTGVSCISSGLALCPASLQTTTQQTSTLTLVTVVASGVDAKFPASTFSSVATTVEFGSKVGRIESMSGSPTSYVPPPPPSTSQSMTSPSETSSPKNGITGKTGGVSNKVIIGVSVGGGLLVLIGILLGVL